MPAPNLQILKRLFLHWHHYWLKRLVFTGSVLWGYAAYRGKKLVGIFAVYDGTVMKANWKPRLKISVIEQRGCPDAASPKQ
ncbi:MAG: hypothetical protein ACR2PX_02390 [Endozoicomonas sp.]|uniref:hypothetical protein n=1 Tax=Endozoicomonas sp. TaxID=1892382 RepID=UPI003D9AC67A